MATPDALAKQLRDIAVRRHEFPVNVVREMLESWRVSPGLEPPCYVNIGNANGKAPLHFAAQLRDDGLADLLLEHKAEANVTTARGHTPLIYACGRGRNDTVLRLLRAGAKCRVRTANGDTAQCMASGRLPASTLEALERAEEDEEAWLDFSLDEKAIAAQADHVQRHPRCAQWACDVPPAVASVLEQRQKQKPQLGVEALVRELTMRWGDPKGIAAALLCAAEPLSRRQAVLLVKTAVMEAAAKEELGGSQGERLLPVLRLAGPVLTAAARELAEGGAGPKRAKEAKVAVTSAVLGALRKLRTSQELPVAELAGNAPPWMVLELLTPPLGVELARDGAALEGVLRKLCHDGAWGSDFGSALRWLTALRPEDASDAAFAGLVAVYVELAVAACNAGSTFKRCLRDDGSLLREAEEALGREALLPLREACERGGLGKVKTRLSPGEEPLLLKPPPDGPFMQKPDGLKVFWVGSAESWAAAEPRLQAASTVAIDTEWWDTGSGPALVQLAIADGDGRSTCFLLDTLHAADVLGPGLRRLFQRDDVTILGWSFGEDRRRLGELCSMDPDDFVATDLQPPACQALGTSSQVSLAVACMYLLGEPLDKREQCSDWRRRPLTKEQEEYAALDAAVLLLLQGKLGEAEAP